MKNEKVCFVLLSIALLIHPLLAAEEPVIYSSSGVMPDPNEPNMQSTAASEPLITFSEYPLDTPITNQYAHLGIIFGGDDPYIERDGAHTTSPVLSGYPQYQGDIEGCFVSPYDGISPATVSWFSFSAGHFEAPGTTRIEWFDLSRNKMGEIVNSVSGIEEIRIEGVGIASWKIGIINSDSAGYTIDNVNFGGLTMVQFTKTDDVEDCVSPEDEITYTICFENGLTQTVVDPVVIDWLPNEVFYPGSVGSFEILDLNDPNTWQFIPPDPGYSEADHSYTWYLDDMDPNSSGCLHLTVTVLNTAPPGGYLHNIAELYGTILVPDEEDPNNLIPEFRLIARAELDTEVCCWQEPPSILYIDEKAPGGNGQSWSTAFQSLQDALTYARSQTCGEIEACYVAQGTYSPGNYASDTFTLPNGVFVYGGFPSGGSEFWQRNPKRYKTTLTGKIDQFLRNDTVVKMADGCLIDGFTISDAGEYCVYGSGVDFSVVNCTVEGSDQYGIRAIDGNVNLNWCTVRNNHEGIWHSGAGFVLNIENCWFKKQGEFGIRCENSVPRLLNSIVTESDLSQTGNAGIRLFYPSSPPVLQNCTISHNKSVGVSVAGTTMPSLVNSIVYHNNSGGRQLSANLNPDVVAQYCCIADCNEVNNNINVDPEFAYFDPNNVRIVAGGPCHDSGLTVLDHYTQFDMDKRDRVLGSAVDRGAYEIECEDAANPFDRNADGRVNFQEFSDFSRFWMAHDPNDPALNDPNHVDYDYLTDPNSPGYVTASSMAAWYPNGYMFNYITTGDSEYRIDLADVMYWAEESPWLWCACWLENDAMEMQAAGGEMMMFAQPFAVAETPVIQQKSVQEQMFDLATAIVFLEQIWLEDPLIQQEIDAQVWQEFMDAVYQNLLDLQTGTIR